MPERSKAVGRIVQALTDQPRTGTLVDHIDGLFDDTVRHIDWTRVLLHAAGRHSALGHASDVFTGIEGVCGPCVREALLITETHVAWTTGDPIDHKALTP